MDDKPVTNQKQGSTILAYGESISVTNLRCQTVIRVALSWERGVGVDAQSL